MLRPFALIAILVVLVSFCHGTELPVSKAPPASNNDIRFVVMPDRTGGMRSGVFRGALKKANLLHPEFVLSVGDLIDGYTLDLPLLDAQWEEFDGMVDALDIPFYYVPGNHDISNPWMEEQWRERLGEPYYHFEYKGALFLILHTEDGGHSGISAEQGAYFEKVLADHSDARWTFLFMHRPLWSYGNQEGFEVVEAALQGRRYTLLSGHHHNYYYEPDAVGNERLILGTAGGGSHLRGEEFGEFDHVTHVVLTEEGPKITHLRLDGFVDKTIVNPGNRSRIEALRSGEFLKVEPTVAERYVAPSLEGRLTLSNPEDSVLNFEIQFPEIEGVIFEFDRLANAVGAGKSLEIPFIAKSTSGGELYLSQLPQLFIEVLGIYGYGTEEELSLPTRELWRVDWNRQMGRDDAARWDWESLDPPGYLTQGWDWHGAEDCSINFVLHSLDDRFVFRAEILDDAHLFIDGELSDRLRLYFETKTGIKEFDFVPDEEGKLSVPEGFSGEASMVKWEGELVFKIDFPFGEIGFVPGDDPFRFNLRYLDHDWVENQKPSRLYWRPDWGSSADYEGSGLFFVPNL